MSKHSTKSSRRQELVAVETAQVEVQLPLLSLLRRCGSHAFRLVRPGRDADFDAPRGRPARHRRGPGAADSGGCHPHRRRLRGVSGGRGLARGARSPGPDRRRNRSDPLRPRTVTWTHKKDRNAGAGTGSVSTRRQTNTRGYSLESFPPPDGRRGGESSPPSPRARSRTCATTRWSRSAFERRRLWTSRNEKAGSNRSSRPGAIRLRTAPPLLSARSRQ